MRTTPRYTLTAALCVISLRFERDHEGEFNHHHLFTGLDPAIARAEAAFNALVAPSGVPESVAFSPPAVG